MSNVGVPELSVIVPVFNESTSLETLFPELARQLNIQMEVIISDGGSTDNTIDVACVLAKKLSLTASIVTSARGRGSQMNTGARVAKGRTFLFLHADSSFSHNMALSKGIQELSAEIASLSNENLAGRFSLKFDHEKGSNLSTGLSLAYYYYENKAYLNRSECVNGDQGMLLRRSFWEKAGPFTEALPFLEDKEFAKNITGKGKWILLSPTIHTSSRRFFQEGIKERQTLNAIIMNYFSSGRLEFISGLPDVYKNQDRTKKMKMYPFFRKIRSILSGFSLKVQMTIWYETGSYILQNAWQIAFYLDIKQEFSRGGIKGRRPLLDFYEKVGKKILINPICKIITTVLVWGWFHLRYVMKR